MSLLRNGMASSKAVIDKYLGTSFDIIKAVYDALTDIRAINASIEDGTLQTWTDIPTTPNISVSSGDLVISGIAGGALEWTSQTPITGYTFWSSLAFGNSTYVAVGWGAGDPEVMTSADGINWFPRVGAVDLQWESVAYGNSLFVAVASDGTGDGVMTSPDGITWTARVPAADLQWKSITYGNGLFVAVADSGTGNRVMTSPDGITWTIRTSASDNNWEDVTYGGGLFVAVASSGTGNRVMTSSDGITWTSRTSAADSDWVSVTYGGGKFVAVAVGGVSNKIMTSSDGISWSGNTDGDAFFWKSVAYGAGRFVAISSSTELLISTDGTTWTLDVAPLNGVWVKLIYGGTMFVAIGSGESTEGAIITSNSILSSLGQIFLGDGSSDDPAYSFLGSKNTGYYKATNSSDVFFSWEGTPITKFNTNGFVIGDVLTSGPTANNRIDIKSGELDILRTSTANFNNINFYKAGILQTSIGTTYTAGTDHRLKVTTGGGIEIDQAASDVPVFTLKSSDVAHGMTDLVETDAYLSIKKQSATAGGASLSAYSENLVGLILTGSATGGSTDSTLLESPIVINGGKKGTTNVQLVAASENLFQVSNNLIPRFTIKGDGALKASDGTVGAPAYGFTNIGGMGLYTDTVDTFFAHSGVATVRFDSSGITVGDVSSGGPSDHDRTDIRGGTLNLLRSSTANHDSITFYKDGINTSSIGTNFSGGTHEINFKIGGVIKGYANNDGFNSEKFTNLGFDFVLGSGNQADSPTGRGNSGQSRALVKLLGNTASTSILAINYASDFSDGVHINGNTRILSGNFTADNAIQAYAEIQHKNSNVAHGMTSYTPTDNYGVSRIRHATEGGLDIIGLSENTIGAALLGFATTVNTSTSTLGAPVIINGAKKSGTTTTAMANGDVLFQVANNGVPGVAVKGNGDLFITGGIFTGGETAPDCSIGGLCLNQGTGDGNIVTFKSSDVAHGITGIFETDTYGSLGKLNSTQGGLVVQGVCDATGLAGVWIRSVGGANASSSVLGAGTVINSAKRSATSTTDWLAGENVFQVANNGTSKLVVKGDGDIESATGAIAAWSDSRLKRDVTDITYNLATINALEFVNYNYIYDSENEPTRTGVIAQQAINVIPELVGGSGEEDDLYNFKYIGLIPILGKAIQELSNANDAKQLIINNLISRIEALEAN